MHILLVDSDTREYLGEDMDWTPPHPWVALPADAVAADAVPLPEARAGFARVLTMQSDGWEYVEDHRGEAGWLADGTPHTVAALGPLPEGWSLTAPPIADKQAAADIRARRDIMLAACDYVMLQDYPLDNESMAGWIVYRQALRDIPSMEGFPWGGDVNVVPWPQKPS